MYKKVLFCSVLQLYFFKTFMAEPIIGKSEPAAVGDFPFIVSLNKIWPFIEMRKSFCSGTLISKRHVLSADHCISEDPVNEITVIVGTVDFSNGKIYRVQSYISYDDWQKVQRLVGEDADDDLGILTLSQDVPNVEPALISKLVARDVYGEDVVTAGWGFTDDLFKVRPETLLKTDLKVLTVAQYKSFTKAKYGKPKTRKPELYYTWSEPPATLGLGDNGGPLLLRSTKEVLGINTAGCLAQEPQLHKYSMSCHLKLDFAHYQGGSGGPLVLASTNELVGVNHGGGIATPFDLYVQFPLPRYSTMGHIKVNYAKHLDFIKEILETFQ